MARRLLKIPAFDTSAVGQPATSLLNSGAGYSYNGIGIVLKKNGALVTLANLATDVDEIRLEADGDPIRRITPALLLAYLKSKKLMGTLTDAAGNAKFSAWIPFVDPSRADVVGMEATRLGTLNVKQLVLVVVLKDPGTAPVYALSGMADWEDAEPRNLTIYERWAIVNFDLINGEKEFNKLKIEDDIFGYLFADAGSITHAKVHVEGVDGKRTTIFDADKDFLLAIMNTYSLTDDNAATYMPLYADFDAQITSRWYTAVRDAQNPKVVISRIGNLVLEITAGAGASVKALQRTLRY